MGNRFLKIVLPLILIGVLAFVIYKANKTFNDIKPTPVGEFSFNAYVDEMIQKEFKGKGNNYDQAKERYRRIYNVILTEENIKITDSKGERRHLLSNDSIQYCYEQAFAAYWPIYKNTVDAFFENDWSNKTAELNSIKDEAEFLKGRNGSSHHNALNQYIAYVDDYYKILAFANKKVSGYNCRSSVEYDKLMREKNDYKKKYPIYNNRALCNKLDSVPYKLKKRWENSVSFYVNYTCKAKDLDEFLSEFTAIYNNTTFVVGKTVCDGKIEEFCNRFYRDDLSAPKEKLNNRWKKLLEDSVDDACRIDNFNDFYPIYSKLNSRIKDYEKKNMRDALDYLSTRLDEQYYKLWHN